MQKLLLLALASLAPLAAHAASFDCAKAQTPVEKLVCADADLSKLDDSLDAAYHLALQRRDVRDKVAASQRAWLKNARNICTTRTCLQSAYQSRIKQLGLTSSFGIVFMTLPPGAKLPPAPPPGAAPPPPAPALPSPAPPPVSPDEYASPDMRCPDNLGAARKYDLYSGSWVTYAQDRAAGFGVSDKAVTLLDTTAEVELARLCDGNVVAVSLSYLPGGHVSDRLYGRLYDSHFQPLGDEFEIADPDKAQSDQSIAPLKSGGFVVTWRTDAGPQFVTDLHARIFGPDGKPASGTFSISANKGELNTQARAYGLPNGGFVVAWLTMHGVYLKYFDAAGKATSDDIEVFHITGYLMFDGNDGTLYGYVARDGSFNLFFPVDNAYIEAPLFSAARSYAMDGTPRTGLLKAGDVEKLAGYPLMKDLFIHRKALYVGMALPGFLSRDKHGRPGCGHVSTAGPWANKILKYSNDPAVVNLIKKVGDTFAACQGGTRY